MYIAESLGVRKSNKKMTGHSLFLVSGSSDAGN